MAPETKTVLIATVIGAVLGSIVTKLVERGLDWSFTNARAEAIPAQIGGTRTVMETDVNPASAGQSSVHAFVRHAKGLVGA